MPRLRCTLMLLSFALAACARERPTAPPPRAVRVAPVAARPVAWSARYSGTLEPRAQLDLAFRVPGRVATVAQVPVAGGGSRPLQEGDAVKAGDALATLDLGDLRRQESAAAAGVASAGAQVQSGRTALAQAQREVSRARKLFQNADLSQAELDRAETAFTAAQSALDAAEAQYRARLDQRALSHSTVVDATLRSPIDGVVSRKAVDPGELVAPNLPAFSVVDLSELKVVFGVPDTRVNSLAPGQAVTVLVEALGGAPRTGTVAKVAPTADPALRTYAVELRLAGGPGLRPGMTATAVLGDEGHSTAPVVPLAAVVRNPGAPGWAVFTVSEGLVSLAPIEVADLLENDVVLRAGLSDPRAQVVVDGAQFLRAGDRVEVLP